MGLNYYKVNYKIKIAYLIVSRAYPGIVKQIEYDYQLTKKIKNLVWKNFTFLDYFGVSLGRNIFCRFLGKYVYQLLNQLHSLIFYLY